LSAAKIFPALSGGSSIKIAGLLRNMPLISTEPGLKVTARPESRLGVLSHFFAERPKLARGGDVKAI
jgi:hypothetical protein